MRFPIPTPASQMSEVPRYPKRVLSVGGNLVVVADDGSLWRWERDEADGTFGWTAFPALPSRWVEEP